MVLRLNTSYILLLHLTFRAPWWEVINDHVSKNFAMGSTKG